MRFVSIASGSSGNCIYTGTEESHILIDAGISAKRIEQGLNEVGLKTSELDGICITHEHSDHIGGLGVISRKSRALESIRKSFFTRSFRIRSSPWGI